jgi:hypothetical protein
MPIGVNGESFGSPQDTEEFFTIDFPEPSPTGTPQKNPGEAPYYSDGSTGSSNAGTANLGTFHIIGYDPYGNPLYAFTPAPVARTYYDLNPGWNTRAEVPEPVGPTMYLSYKAGAAVGAIVGLTAAPATRAGYEDIILGWMTLKGVAYIVARGEILFSVPTATTLPDPGKYNRDVDALTMRKTMDRVEFFLTSATGQGGEVKIAEATMTEEVTYVTAALYLGGDVISDEILEYPNVLAGAFPALFGGFYESSTASYLMGEMPALTGDLHEDDNSVMSSTLPMLAGFFGDNANSYMTGNLPAMTGDFSSFVDAEIGPDFNYTFSDIPALVGAFMVRDVTFGTLTATSPALGGFFSDSQGGSLRGTLPALRGGFAEAEFPDRLMVVSRAYTASRSIMRPTAYLVFNSTMEVVATLDADEVARMLLESSVTADSSADFTAIVYALLSSVMTAGDIASLQRDGMSVWALHMDSMGSTRYENFDFNSFMTLDGKTYGVNATGIHLLEGDTDGADTITASVDFGSLNFGNNSRKAMPYVYIGMASSGKTVLKVESDGQTYYYTARDATTLMKTHRFELGRGLRSNFYGFTLQSDGRAFDLHNIEFFPLELKRRL